MRRRIAAAIAAALLAGSCGSEDAGEFTTRTGESAEYTIDRDSGETRMTIEQPDGPATLRSGAGVPVRLPEGFSLFPGTRVITNTLVTQPDWQGAMVIFAADGAAEAIIAHYRRQAEAAGFEIAIDATMNGSLTIGGERQRDGSTFSVTATGNPGAASSGQLIIGSKAGG